MAEQPALSFAGLLRQLRADARLRTPVCYPCQALMAVGARLESPSVRRMVEGAAGCSALPDLVAASGLSAALVQLLQPFCPVGLVLVADARADVAAVFVIGVVEAFLRGPDLLVDLLDRQQAHAWSMAALVAVRVRHGQARLPSRCTGCGSASIIGYVYPPDGGGTRPQTHCSGERSCPFSGRPGPKPPVIAALGR
jgi:hypothetical protein